MHSARVTDTVAATSQRSFVHTHEPASRRQTKTIITNNTEVIGGVAGRRPPWQQSQTHATVITIYNWSSLERSVITHVSNGHRLLLGSSRKDTRNFMIQRWRQVWNKAVMQSLIKTQINTNKQTIHKQPNTNLSGFKFVQAFRNITHTILNCAYR